MKNNNEIIIDPYLIFWNIEPILVNSEEDGPLVQLQWGWTANMTQKELNNIAEDTPTGFDSVTTTLDMAKELRDKLNKIIGDLE